MKLTLETETGIKTLEVDLPEGAKYEACVKEFVDKAALRTRILHAADQIRGDLPIGTCVRILRADEYSNGNPLKNKIAVIQEVSEDRIWLGLEDGSPITLIPGRCELKIIGHCNLTEEMWKVDYDFDCSVSFTRDFTREEKDDLFHRIKTARQGIIDSERDYRYMFA